jgi:hypothetical protein
MKSTQTFFSVYMTCESGIIDLLASPKLDLINVYLIKLGVRSLNFFWNKPRIE